MSMAALAQPAPRDINSSVASRDVDFTAADGTKLKGSFYPAANTNGKSAPAVMLLHMCNTDRKSWAPVAEQLSAAGISALTVDNRGFGESGGPRAEGATPEQQQELQEKWPSDFDIEFAWLLQQPNVDKYRIGAGGGSCGVNNVVQLARRHPEIRTLVLLAGPTDMAGINYLVKNSSIPLFTAAAADDEYISDAPAEMRWFAEVSGNPRSKFVGFQNGRHGTEIFGPHPELPKQIVAFYVDTLVTNPASETAKFTPRKTPASEFWAAASQPGGAARAAQIYYDAKKKNPNAFVIDETVVNMLGYERLQSVGINMGGANPAPGAPSTASPQQVQQAKQDALTLLKLNAEAFPNSANAQDSLADAYLANGQKAEALAAEQKCLELLPNDNSQNDQFKQQLREAAEGKIAKLKGSDTTN
jgi:dienelactone hydrolase